MRAIVPCRTFNICLLIEFVSYALSLSLILDGIELNFIVLHSCRWLLVSATFIYNTNCQYYLLHSIYFIFFRRRIRLYQRIHFFTFDFDHFLVRMWFNTSKSLYGLRSARCAESSWRAPAINIHSVSRTEWSQTKNVLMLLLFYVIGVRRRGVLLHW